IAESAEYQELDNVKKKIIQNALRDFKLSGVSLPEKEKTRYRAIQQRLAELSNTFSNHVLDATMAWTKHFPTTEGLQGLPESALENAAETAKSRAMEGYLITLEIPSYLAVITYADNRALRQEIYTAYVTRASDQGPFAGKWDNTRIMEELLALKHEKAQMLGFSNYAELSLVTKTASNPEQVLNFLTDLANRSKASAMKEMAELKEFAETKFGQSDLASWDLAYFSEKLKQERYAVSSEEFRPYFPENRVLEGLFEIVKRLYGLDIREAPTEHVWHESVRFFQIFDEFENHRGSFYLDLYARQHKRGGAWMDQCMSRFRKSDQVLQSPVAYLVCNLNKPSGNKPALFTHDEVQTLFHEFGHGLHHMLTLVDYPDVAGVNGVPWDAVELPSQFMENWLWQEDALKLVSAHYETGEPLPPEKLQRLLKARNFQSAMQMMRQLEFSLFDFRIHQEYQPAHGGRVQQILDEVRSNVSVVPVVPYNRFQHGFTHIFAGGYAAGYYSYKWAEVLSSDAFSRFEEEGIFNPETGGDFLHSILEPGGSHDPMELFEEFRGRSPSILPLLKHNGILVEEKP
ncbi:MAG: M3 family metallopeptidase, partial [SAR324 cluster bacterium]|nr:M3 family metallopeptidase [SAR324 cluster bacterium]